MDFREVLPSRIIGNIVQIYSYPQSYLNWLKQDLDFQQWLFKPLVRGERNDGEKHRAVNQNRPRTCLNHNARFPLLDTLP